MMSRAEKELSVEVAAQDSDLRALYELEVFGAALAVEPSRAAIIEDYSDEEVLQLRADIQRCYGLSDRDMKRAIARCVASIVDVQVGISEQNQL